MNHIQAVSRVSIVIEVCQEYHLPLVLTFVDYEKAFDSVATNAILSALVDQGIDPSYIRTLADCNKHCTTTLQLFIDHSLFQLVKEYDRATPYHPSCSQLFCEFIRLIQKEDTSWWTIPLQPSFADDIAILSNSIAEAETMFVELNEAGKKIGLRISRKKTNI